MRSLASRIERFERNQPPCPRCRGKGKTVAIELDEFEPVPPIDPSKGCELCGEVDLLIFRWVNEPAYPGGPMPEGCMGRTSGKGLFD